MVFTSSFSFMVQSGVIFIHSEEFSYQYKSSGDKTSQLLCFWKIFSLVLKDKILGWHTSLKFQIFKDIIHSLLSSIVSAEKAIEFCCFPLRIMCLFAFYLLVFHSFPLVFGSLFIFICLSLLRYNRQKTLEFSSSTVDTVFFIFIQLGVWRTLLIFGLIYFIMPGNLEASISSDIAFVAISSHLLLGFQLYMC